MAAINWHDGLNVGVDFMDDDHAEAAALINSLIAASMDERPRLMGHFIAHCREHFAREDAMMQQTGFFAMHCHQGEHTRVLAELEEVLARLHSGEPQDSYFTKTLPEWMMIHRGTMDIVTAQFAQTAGFSG